MSELIEDVYERYLMRKRQKKGVVINLSKNGLGLSLLTGFPNYVFKLVCAINMWANFLVNALKGI